MKRTHKPCGHHRTFPCTCRPPRQPLKGFDFEVRRITHAVKARLESVELPDDEAPLMEALEMFAELHAARFGRSATSNLLEQLSVEYAR